ncbi:MAG: hypothetical protein HRU43_01010 [Simkaniaceae bacterium]|nr:hypothetical protein [Simkaniaceae bacterium]
MTIEDIFYLIGSIGGAYFLYKGYKSRQQKAQPKEPTPAPSKHPQNDAL